jgi:NAD(P)-dependent dehydrogenase (short-subunit alcohol dehydrogenase family)
MSNQVALITGGATGIGKAVALKLAAKGVTVIMSGRRAEVGKAAVAEVSAAARNGAQVRFVGWSRFRCKNSRLQSGVNPW